MAAVNKRNRWGQTALWLASHRGRTESVRLLLRAGRWVREGVGWGELKWCGLFAGSPWILMGHMHTHHAGADPTLTPQEGRTPREAAAAMARPTCVALLEVRQRQKQWRTHTYGQTLVQAVRAVLRAVSTPHNTTGSRGTL
jgi:ankyrin repeat protein